MAEPTPAQKAEAVAKAAAKAPEQPEPAEGGRYLVNGQLVDANGKPVGKKDE